MCLAVVFEPNKVVITYDIIQFGLQHHAVYLHKSTTHSAACINRHLLSEHRAAAESLPLYQGEDHVDSSFCSSVKASDGCSEEFATETIY